MKDIYFSKLRRDSRLEIILMSRKNLIVIYSSKKILGLFRKSNYYEKIINPLFDWLIKKIEEFIGSGILSYRVYALLKKTSASFWTFPLP